MQLQALWLDLPAATTELVVWLQQMRQQQMLQRPLLALIPVKFHHVHLRFCHMLIQAGPMKSRGDTLLSRAMLLPKSLFKQL